MKIEMKKFGEALTGREYGKNVAEKFFSSVEQNICLDFSNVISMGSSFGDEIFKVMKRQGVSHVTVVKYNKAIEDCLKEISSELSITINFSK